MGLFFSLDKYIMKKHLKEKIYDPKIDALLSKYGKSRDELLSYLTDLDKLKTKIESIFPTTIDYRSKFVLEEKIKAMSAFFGTMLNVRQEYNRTIKDEITLRQKITDDENDDPQDIDVRAIADQVDKIQTEKNKKKSK